MAVPARLDLKSILQHFLDFRLEVVTRRLRHELENLLQPDPHPRRLRDRLQQPRRGDPDHPRQRRQGRRRPQADRAVRPLRGPGRRRPRDQALPAGQARDQGHPRRAGPEAPAGRRDPEAARRRARALEDHPGRAEGDRQRLRRRAVAPGSRAAAAPVEYREEDYIVDEDAWVIVTRDGWTKRQKSFTDVASIRVRDDDRVGWVYRARARQTLTFFTDRGIAYTLRVNDIPHDDRPRRADPEAVRLRGQRAHRRRPLPRPALPARARRHAPDAAHAGPGAARRRARARSTATATATATRRCPPPPYAHRPDGRGQGPAIRAGARWRPSRPARDASVVRLDPAVPDDLVVGVEATDGSENVCLATRSARVLIFPVTEANVVARRGQGRHGDQARRQGPRPRLRAGQQDARGPDRPHQPGATQIVRATKYPVTGRGGRGYGILQRGSLDAVIHDEARPVPPVEEVGE